jgi:hypothetical protein
MSSGPRPSQRIPTLASDGVAPDSRSNAQGPAHWMRAFEAQRVFLRALGIWILISIGAALAFLLIARRSGSDSGSDEVLISPDLTGAWASLPRPALPTLTVPVVPKMEVPRSPAGGFAPGTTAVERLPTGSDPLAPGLRGAPFPGSRRSRGHQIASTGIVDVVDALHADGAGRDSRGGVNATGRASDASTARRDDSDRPLPPSAP